MIACSQIVAARALMAAAGARAEAGKGGSSQTAARERPVHVVVYASTCHIALSAKTLQAEEDSGEEGEQRTGEHREALGAPGKVSPAAMTGRASMAAACNGAP